MVVQADGVTPCQRVGIMYAVWHWPAWNAQRVIGTKAGTQLNMEQVLKSRTEQGELLTRARPGLPWALPHPENNGVLLRHHPVNAPV